MKYGLLHYRGDLTADIEVGQILGCDEVFHPYAVTDAEYQAEVDCTTVWLETATAEQLKAAQR